MESRRIFRSIFIVSLVGIVITLQILSQNLVSRFNLKIDLTEESLYELSDKTIQIIDGLETPVEITVFNSEEDFVIMLKEILRRYENRSPNIILNFVDPYENPLLVDRLLEKGIQVKPDDIVVEGPNSVRAFTVEDMYVFNAGQTRILGLNAEQKLSSALLDINSDTSRLAAFVDGHNERPSESLQNLFVQNSFDITRGPLISILRSSPDLIVIAAPGRDFLGSEIRLLNDYLDSGGVLMLFLEPTGESFVELESLLREWGILAGDKLVLEPKAFTGNNPLNIVPMYGPHLINRFFQDTRVFITMPSSRNLEIRPDVGSAYTVASVLNSTVDSYGKSFHQFTELRREVGDAGGPFSLALSSVKEVLTADGTLEARVLTVGSRSIYADDLLSYDTYGNADFLVQAINWLTDSPDSLSIPAKNVQSAPLNITRNQVFFIGAAVAVLLPSLVAVFGIIVLVHRKKLS